MIGSPSVEASRAEEDESHTRALRLWATASHLIRRIGSCLALVTKASPRLLIGCLVATLAMGLMPVATAWLTKMVLDQIVGRTEWAALLGASMGLALAGLMNGVVPHISQYFRSEMERASGMLAQDRLFAAVGRLAGLGWFENPRHLDRLRLAQQAGGLAPNTTVNGLLNIARSGVTLTGFFASLLFLSPLMTGLVLIAGVPALVGELALSRRRARVFWDVGPAERREVFYAELQSSVAAAKEVRLFGIGTFLRERMLADRAASNQAKRAVDRREVAVQASLSLVTVIVSSMGLLWAVGAAHRGELSAGDITIFVAAIAGVQGGLTSMARDLARAHQALLLYEHYHAVTTSGPDLPQPATLQSLPTLRNGIELRDVWFRYSDEHPWILRGISLTIPHGQSVGLVGVNGSGKSTIVKLLCRFYDPTRGSITWDGLDIREVDVAQLRHRISATFQDYMHYDMTAAENIGLGDIGHLDDHVRIAAAAKRAGVHKTLTALPHGYRTLLSRNFFLESEKNRPETGVVLSGGQWQRLALARACMRDERDLLILDEPSAGLDAEAEYEIHTSLREHRAGRTSLLISHRLSALREANRIVVLSEGQVAEQGEHEALIAAGGLYARLFTIQASGYYPDLPGPILPKKPGVEEALRVV
ncbi:ABC transporter ATP-binding protein [Nonomuraea sp. NPDC001831]|uniref:ABC transporter ATP-binding protein n=1 Tax=Nonomuraea sp. NPDC001831 TaxID=3364340 RepID=UPI0036BDDDC8